MDFGPKALRVIHAALLREEARLRAINESTDSTEDEIADSANDVLYLRGVITTVAIAHASAIETRRAETREAGLGAKPESAAPEGGDAQ